DYEAPLGAPISYSVLTINADGTGSEYRTTDTVILDPGDPNYVGLTDPARPGVGLRVLVKQAPEWKAAIEQTVYRVRQRSTP
ncbi:hypothetical protein KBZ21_40605, partial [Streptomyces sp. A73]|nr:hypothetical protein [Streptomyces sp. A73]